MKFKSWRGFKAAWVKALRSGQYRQTTNWLVNENDRFCCLGVAGNLLIEAGHDLEWKHAGSHWYLGNDKTGNAGIIEPELMPPWMKQKLHIGAQQRLAEHNDGGKNFEAIAKIIEESL